MPVITIEKDKPVKKGIYSTCSLENLSLIDLY